MTEELPDPLVPADVDLRGLEYMPFFGNHLFGSEFNAACTDSEWRAGLTLWWAAWNQVPAGSLPEDDAALTRLADLGRDLKAWRKVKAKALHGFVKCSDGRLYHSFVCKQALIAWKKRVQEREKKRKWREEMEQRKRGQEPGQAVNGTGTGTGTSMGTEPGQNRDATVPSRLTGRDVTGRDGKPKENPAAKAADPVKDEIWKMGKTLLSANGDTKEAGSFLGKLCKDYGQILVLQAIQDCSMAGPVEPKGWLVARCQERRKKEERNAKFNPVQYINEQQRKELARVVDEKVVGSGSA